MTSPCLTDAASRSIGGAVQVARAAAQTAPLFWVSRGNEPHACGPHVYTETADAGHTFVRWRWDGCRLTIESDASGLLPTFVYRRGPDFAISTSIEKLLDAGAVVHPDWPALAVFVRVGFFVGEDTPFVEIRALPPAAQVVWESGQTTVTGAPYIVPPSTMSRDEAIDHAVHLTRRAVMRRTPVTPFAVPLSGGRDSRHILFALLGAGYLPQFAVTVPRYPPAADEDERIAAVVARSVRVRHDVLEQTEHPAAAEARKNVATNYCADEHAWFLPMLDYVAARVPLAYEGIGGSLWTTGWLPEQEHRALWKSGGSRLVAARMLQRYRGVSEPFLNGLLAHPACTEPQAIDRLARELERHTDAPDPGKSFHFWNRLRRELALVPFGYMRQLHNVHTPLVDAALVNFLLSLTPETISPTLSRRDKSFHSEAIARAFPALAAIPFENDAAPNTDARMHNRLLTRAVARHLLQRCRRPRFMRGSYIWPRIAYTLTSSRYAEATPWFARTALYLAQLEEVAA